MVEAHNVFETPATTHVIDYPGERNAVYAAEGGGREGAWEWLVRGVR